MAWWKSAGRQQAAKQAARPANRLLLQALEPRMMFDGAVAATANHVAQHVGVMHDPQDAGAQQHHGEARPAA
ncbi:LEPR-XLL domain-containing protein, partial [Chromobacterium subtsugae]